MKVPTFAVDVGEGARAPTAAGIAKWFAGQGFVQAEFVKPKIHVTTCWLAHTVSYKLVRRDGFATFWREGYGGSLIVFEVARRNHLVLFDGYCPLWIFGLFCRRLPFRETAKGMFRYRREGYTLRTKFLRFLGAGSVGPGGGAAGQPGSSSGAP